ncbi:hypothetical protein Tdes44962_MAKER09243 [Teratosphaeria destructans]|uniref:Nudix hydrolase domain-containing protein n=1 Tax=Teratosphaeria destructans TaxID=418781 RepID=A0A9W7STU1_9PEZI|nr:hypothetical protein Tdes44962_MAKER09243 [Teratosphaeria destructans]
MPPAPSTPVHASFPSTHLTIGAGVAIFHLATARVVLCHHPGAPHWFLPKGRRNANEDTIRAAEREGFEETGYRNRVIPIPLRHRQPRGAEEVFVTEPVWTQLLPVTAASQYLLFWYVAETVPRGVEEECGEGGVGGDGGYRPPARYPAAGCTVKQRIALDAVAGGGAEGEVYEPVWHRGTGVNEEEMMYESYLLPIDKARRKLKGSVMEDVVKRGWEGIQLRMEMEEQGGLLVDALHAETP